MSTDGQGITHMDIPYVHSITRVPIVEGCKVREHDHDTDSTAKFGPPGGGHAENST